MKAVVAFTSPVFAVADDHAAAVGTVDDLGGLIPRAWCVVFYSVVSEAGNGFEGMSPSTETPPRRAWWSAHGGADGRANGFSSGAVKVASRVFGALALRGAATARGLRLGAGAR